jgi:hypothetical protein
MYNKMKIKTTTTIPHIHDHSLSSLDTDTSVKSGGAKLVLWVQSSFLSEMTLNTNNKIYNSLPDSVVMEFVITRHGQKTPKSYSKRIKYLCSSVSPHLELNIQRKSIDLTVIQYILNESKYRYRS